MGFYGLLFGGALGLIGLMLLAWMMGARRSASEAEAPKGLETVSGALFALFGLLLAFSFSASASRFEQRRTISLQEANAIGTAALRLDLLPRDAQAEARAIFKAYLDSRYRYLSVAGAGGEYHKEWDEVQRIQSRLWSHAINSGPTDRQVPSNTVLLPALNEMFDITSTRHIAIQTHVPVVIVMLLGLFAVITSYLGGRLAHRTPSTRAVGVLYTACVVITLLVMIDIDFPRRGLIRANNADILIEDLRAKF